MKKKQILTFIDWFLPGYKAGGPIRSVANIVESLQDEYEYFIVTRNNDLGEKTSYDGILSDQWHDMYFAHVYYISDAEYSFRTVKRLMSERNYDLLYLNSLFSPRFTLIPLVVKKLYFSHLETLLAPRGMLGTLALKSKGFKKRVFMLAAKVTRLYRGIRWHATTADEQKQIQLHFGKCLNIRIGECITHAAKLIESDKAVKTPGEAKLFYIGRLARHKNIAFVLEFLSRYRINGKVTLDIFGAIEEKNYYSQCCAMIQKMKDNVTVNIHGAVPYEQLRKRIIQEFHFMVLPSKGESYSHAVLDSWACGCPVLVSDRTPWRDLESRELGWVYGISSHSEFERQLEKALEMNRDTYLRSAGKCVSFVNVELCKPEIIERNRIVFS